MVASPVTELSYTKSLILYVLPANSTVPPLTYVCTSGVTPIFALNVLPPTDIAFVPALTKVCADCGRFLTQFVAADMNECTDCGKHLIASEVALTNSCVY